MSVDLKTLADLLATHKRATESEISRFRYPITLRDVDSSDLIDGHILNESITVAPRKTVIQWADVDHYYGRTVEPPFIASVNLVTDGTNDLLKDAKNFQVDFLDGSSAEAFVPSASERTAAGRKFPGVRFDVGNGEDVVAFLRISKDDPRAQDGKFTIRGKLPAPRCDDIAAVVKAGYLTMFWMIGYQVLQEPCCEFIRQSLDAFFRDRATPEQADHYFWPFADA